MSHPAVPLRSRLQLWKSRVGTQSPAGSVPDSLVSKRRSVSSLVWPLISGASVPDSGVPKMDKSIKLVMMPTADDSVPDSLVPKRRSVSRLVRLPIASGSVPDSPVPERSKVTRLVKQLTSGGSVPDSLVLTRSRDARPLRSRMPAPPSSKGWLISVKDTVRARPPPVHSRTPAHRLAGHGTRVMVHGSHGLVRSSQSAGAALLLNTNAARNAAPSSYVQLPSSVVTRASKLVAAGSVQPNALAVAHQYSAAKLSAVVLSVDDE